METVTRIRQTQTGTDRYGNPEFTEAEVDIPGAMFAPEQSSMESVEVGREALTIRPTLYWSGQWPDINARDHLRVRGVEYAVHGEPADWRYPWSGTGPGGLVVVLKAVEG